MYVGNPHVLASTWLRPQPLNGSWSTSGHQGRESPCPFPTPFSEEQCLTKNKWSFRITILKTVGIFHQILQNETYKPQWKSSPGKKVFAVRVVRHWSRLPRDVDAPSLEVVLEVLSNTSHPVILSIVAAWKTGLHWAFVSI